MKTRKMI